MKSRLLFLLLSLSLLIACGGGSKSTNTTSSGNVTLSPATASVPINTTAQFTASVANSTAGVYWSVNGGSGDVIGGNTTIGTINSAGLYTAPAVIPSPATVTVKATSAADSTQFATAQVTVTSGTALTISVSPTTASVYTGRTQQFTANFNVATNTGVTWQVNSVTGGDSTHGTITTTGLYTAPTTVPSPATVTITAVSQSDTTKTATATVTIVPGTVISISPAYTNVAAGATQTFTATANNQAIAVTWSLNCQSTATGGCGSLSNTTTASSTTVFTAPAYPPPGGGTVAITATPTDNSALPAGATAAIQIANGSLSGQYAFSMSGTAGGKAYVAAGSLKFDGAGNITSGVEDYNDGAVGAPTITGGSYHIGTDGRGNVTVQTSAGTQTWQIALKDNTKAFLMRTGSGTTGTGVLRLQNTSQFAIGSINGNYTLGLSPAPGQNAAAYAGVLTADGAGTISGGLLDISNGATVSTALAATGSYTAPDATTGRGTVTVTTSSGTQHVAYYLVGSDRAMAVDVDGGSVVAGELVQQSGSSFSATSFGGSYAMVTSGTNAQGPLAIGSVVVTDGAGNVSSGTGDINANGNTQSQVAVTGTYSVTDAATGRTEFTLTIGGQARKFVVYPQASGIADALEIDGVQTTSGRAYLQAANASSTSAFQGTYATSLTGIDFINTPGEIDVNGLLVPNGGSAIAGTLDVNDAGTVVHAASLQGTYLVSTTTTRNSGNWTTGASLFGSGQFVYYVVDSNRALVLELDSNRVATGVMEKAY